MSDESKPISSPSPTGPGIKDWLRGSEAGLALAIVAVLGLIYVIAPGPSDIFNLGASRPFFSQVNLQNTFHQMALIGVLSVGVAVVIIAGGIDLSIGSMVALSAVVSGKLMTSWLPGVGEAGPWATGLLVAASVTLLGWTGLNLFGQLWTKSSSWARFLRP